MRELRGRVAVITGAGSGIGEGLVRACASEGMRVVAADIDEARVKSLAEEISAGGADCLAVVCDVSRRNSVAELARAAYGRFGAVHLLCNNAGVLKFAPLLETSEADWAWMLGVNLWGVIHGVSIFVPRMLEGGEEGHVVNTASIAALASGIEPGIGAYSTTKFAVISLSETLRRELAASPIGVSVLCPGAVRTRIISSARVRPAEFGGPEAPPPGGELLPVGMKPLEVAREVLAAVREDRFYIPVNHADYVGHVETRLQEIVAALKGEQGPTD